MRVGWIFRVLMMVTRHLDGMWSRVTLQVDLGRCWVSEARLK